MATALYALNIADNVVTSLKIKDGEVKAIDIGSDEVVKSIKGLKEAIDIVAGNPNIRIKVDGQNIVIEGKDTVKAAEQLIGGIPSGVPVGSIIAYWGNTPPEGWLLCDSSIIPSQYQSLIDFLGSSRTPDLRGMFLRGSNTTINSSSKGNDGDPDEGSRSSGIGVSRIGSRQGDAFQSHSHTISVKRTGGIQMNYVAAPGTYDDAGTAGTNMSGTSSETRPKNVYVNYIIKAK
jgi:microcystin-dependent protein